MTIPYRPLQECLNFVEKIFRFSNGEKVSTKELLDILKLNHPRNKRYQQICSSSMEYGLLDANLKGYVRISRLGLNLLFPDKENFENTFLLRFKAFLKSEIFRELVKNYQNKKIPEDEELKQILTKMNFSKSSSTIELALKSFVKSSKYLGLLTDSRELVLDEYYTNVLNNKDAIKLIDYEEIYEEKLALEKNQSTLNNKTKLTTFESIKRNLHRLENYNYSLIILEKGREALFLAPLHLSEIDVKMINNSVSEAYTD